MAVRSGRGSLLAESAIKKNRAQDYENNNKHAQLFVATFHNGPPEVTSAICTRLIAI